MKRKVPTEHIIFVGVWTGLCFAVYGGIGIVNIVKAILAQRHRHDDSRFNHVRSMHDLYNFANYFSQHGQYPCQHDDGQNFA